MGSLTRQNPALMSGLINSWAMKNGATGPVVKNQPQGPGPSPLGGAPAPANLVGPKAR